MSRWDSFFYSALLVLSKSANLLWQWPADTAPHILPQLEGSSCCPGTCSDFPLVSLELSPPQNMPDLMDLAFPNLFTALAPAGLEEIGAGDDLLGLIIVEFYSIDLYVCWLTCYQIRSLKEHKYCQQELNHPSLITSFSTSSKNESWKCLDLMLHWTAWLLLLDHSRKVCGWLLPVYLLPSEAPPFLPSWFYPSWDLKWRTLSRNSKDKKNLTRHIVNSSSQYLSSSLRLELQLLR